MTVNKSQGDTIPGTLAVEMSVVTCPWEKEQIVVIFSRTKRASDIIIVGGDKGWIKDMLWKLATTSNQWSSMMENILNALTINTIESDTNNNTSTVDFAENYPYEL